MTEVSTEDQPFKESSGSAELRLLAKEIAEKDLPVFSRTIARISSVDEDEDIDFLKLSQTILRDAGLTQKIISLSNSAFRSRRAKTNTVSRALVMLGVKEIKRICLTCSFLEDMLSDDPDGNLVREMAQAFHSATQVRLIALHKGERGTEEAFLNGLAKSFGAMAFWHHGGEQSKRLAEFIKEHPELEVERAEQHVLGFTLAELSDALVAEWGMAGLVLDRDSKDDTVINRLKAVQLSNSFARNYPKGPDSPVVKRLVTEFDAQLGLSSSVVETLIENAVKEAAEAASELGATELVQELQVYTQHLAPLLSSPAESIDENVSEEESSYELVVDENDGCFEPDIQYQVSSLQKAASMIKERVETSDILNTLLLGIHRGIGMDRSALFVVHKELDAVVAIGAVGSKSKDFRSSFRFPLDPLGHDLFSYVLAQEQILNLEPEDGLYKKFMTDELKAALGHGAFILAPLKIHDSLGLVYLDRRVTGRELGEKEISALEPFIVRMARVLSWVS